MNFDFLKKRLCSGSTNIIYAIEEPEVSQHTDNQRKLIEALRTLSEFTNTQVVITTHSATVLKSLDISSVRMVSIENLKKKVSNVPQTQLPYSSLNEINFLAFCESTEEFHNELYGFIEKNNALSTFNDGQAKRCYKKILKDSSVKEFSISLSEYIRHQIHHPENENNIKYTQQELSNSIELMRDFIRSNAVFCPD